MLQDTPQAVPSQLAAPLEGARHGEHESPQVLTLVFATHALPQR